MTSGTKIVRWAAALTLAATLGASATAQTSAPTTAILGAMVFDGTGAEPRRADVLIRQGRIAAIGPKLRVPRGAAIVEARGMALLPGFFDVHTHWTPAGSPAITPSIASAYVAAGVTTVNDFHQSPESWAPRRAWLATLAAPHVNMTARTSTPGGHGADWADQSTTKWFNTPQGARAGVRALAPYKPDAIKAFADGWRYGTAPDNTSMDVATLAAVVEEAHRQDLKVLTHTVTVDRGKVAARAKVDIIAHSLQDRPVDAEAIALLKAAGTAYAPTLAVYEPVKPGQAQPADPNDPRHRNSVAKFAHAMANVKALHDGGVPVALGTDAGMPGTRHGFSTLREMELLVQAGLTPTQALMAGTSVSARAMGLLADRGTIAPGKRADLVLVDGAPWREITALHRTQRVWIDGRLVHGPGAVIPPANARDRLAATPARPLIDDFERPDGRTALDTLRIDGMDGGHDRSVQVSQTIVREGGGRALSLAARMAVKDDARAGVILPLTRGSVAPVDARAFKGVRLDARGDGGPYAVTLNTLAGRWSAALPAGTRWGAVELPFTAFRRSGGRGAASGPWAGDDLLELEIGAERPGGEKVWLEVDNVGFY